MQVWTFLHVTFMFASVAISLGWGWFATVAAWRRDLGALRAYVRMSARTVAHEAVLALLGVGFGFAAAIAGGLDLLQGWLVLAYVLVGVSLANNVVSGPIVDRTKAALEVNEGDQPGQELKSILAAPWLYLSMLASTAIFVAIIWDMFATMQGMTLADGRNMLGRGSIVLTSDTCGDVPEQRSAP